MTLRYGLYSVLIVGALVLAADGVASGDGLTILLAWRLRSDV